ncbi:Uncharacterised protein [uncultured archaeon]|nr:Uncharacterised protein [uncultured archaeon]
MVFGRTGIINEKQRQLKKQKSTAKIFLERLMSILGATEEAAFPDYKYEPQRRRDTEN